MTLDVGNVHHIENPTADAVQQHLRHLPRQAPFLTLSKDDKRFIQAKPYSGGYRVEWHDGRESRRALATMDATEKLMLAYLRGDDSAVLRDTKWRQLSVYNDPFYWLLAAGAVCAAVLTWLLGAEVWHMIR
jgi:hypothetical protein